MYSLSRLIIQISFWQDDGNSFTHTSVRGEAVEIYGKGIYRFDSLLMGAGNRGVDAVVLIVAIPFFLITVMFYLRSSLRAGMLLLGMLGYFLYIYGTLSLGAAYNAFFVLYVVLFSASFYAFIVLLLRRITEWAG